MRKREGSISLLLKRIGGIFVEVFATLVMMGVVFIIGFFISRWFSK
ncbi:MAG: hypothetical protein HQ547_02465 [Candidatus Omnitrophica bacterium]|nr:hypothetical protein [Candidatus Omnitrophota bacterium]